MHTFVGCARTDFLMPSLLMLIFDNFALKKFEVYIIDNSKWQEDSVRLNEHEFLIAQKCDTGFGACFLHTLLCYFSNCCNSVKISNLQHKKSCAQNLARRFIVNSLTPCHDYHSLLHH